MDIIGMYIDNKPDYIKNIELHIRGFKILNLDLSKNNILEDLPICMSKLKDCYAELVFDIDKEYLEKHERYTYTDEYIVEEKYSDNECDFFDGYNIRRGYKINYKNVKT